MSKDVALVLSSGDAIALRLQFLNGTDMGKTSRTTARQY